MRGVQLLRIPSPWSLIQKIVGHTFKDIRYYNLSQDSEFLCILNLIWDHLLTLSLQLFFVPYTTPNKVVTKVWTRYQLRKNFLFLRVLRVTTECNKHSTRLSLFCTLLLTTFRYTKVEHTLLLCFYFNLFWSF